MPAKPLSLQAAMQQQTQEPPALSPQATAAAMLREIMAANGRKGGKSRSAAKLGAIAGNLAKARAARWAKGRKVTAASG